MNMGPERPEAAAPEAEARLLSWRSEFPILSTSTYLISNSLGAMPAAVYDSLRHYADTWAGDGVGAWEKEWWLLAEEVGDSVAPLIGAPPRSVSAHLNVTSASAIVASCFEYRGERNRIVCSELNFPSIVQQYRQQERLGAELHLVASPDGFTVPTEAMVAAIDERTLLVPISHVIFRSGYCQDIEPIVARAHEVGARVVLDVYQSAGVMPIDVRELDVDFAVGGVLKWLCGGPGLAFLYAHPERTASLRPRITGWFARDNAFAFDPRDDSWRGDSWRFLNGTTHIPSFVAALPGLRIVNRLDLHEVRAKSLRQTGMVIDAAQERGWQARTPRDGARRGGHAVIQLPAAERIAAQLLERRIMVDYRPGAGIRIAPHFYTTDDEVRRALDAIVALSA